MSHVPRVKSRFPDAISWTAPLVRSIIGRPHVHEERGLAPFGVHGSANLAVWADAVTLSPGRAPRVPALKCRLKGRPLAVVFRTADLLDEWRVSKQARNSFGAAT